MKKNISVILVLAAVLLLCCCGKQNPQIAQVSFDSNPTTGYQWYAFQSSDLFEISSEYTSGNDDPNITGAGGTECFTLKPLKEGHCEVAFVYQRPWEAIELGDTYTYDVTVSKDMQISVKGGTAQITGNSEVPPAVPVFVISESK